MSSNNTSSSSYSYSSSSFSASTSSSSANGQPPTTTRYTERTHSSSEDGTTVHRTREETGQPTQRETRHYPAQHGAVEGGGGGGNARIQDVTDDEQAQRDREYEERIEDEYAKREGGA